ncbi:MAG: MFS transporter [Rhizomicrobium sp.]
MTDAAPIIDTLAPGVPLAAPHPPTSTAAQVAWLLLDASRSPYVVFVNIFVFSAYFTTVVVPDPVRGQILWSYITVATAIGLALGAPLLGAIADAGGRRKPWIAGCIVVGIPCMSALWFATPGMTLGIGWVIAALVVSNLAFEFSAVFCNAMLTSIAPPGGIGRLSGFGLAMGNLVGIVLFLFFLYAWLWNPHPLFGLSLSMHEPERAVGFIAALSLALFGLPVFFAAPDTAGTRIGAVAAIQRGARALGHTIIKVREYRNIVLFLLARVVFNEGFVVMVIFTGVFAAGILHWTADMVIMQGIFNSITALLGALVAGWMDTRFGSKRSTMVFLGLIMLLNVVLLSLAPGRMFFLDVSHLGGPGGMYPTWPDVVFFGTQLLVAFSVTGGFTTSRALMAKLSPPDMMSEFFGLYALSGTATSFVAPLAIGVITDVFQSQRAGVAVGIVFLVGGLLMMLPVREERIAAS